MFTFHCTPFIKQKKAPEWEPFLFRNHTTCQSGLLLVIRAASCLC